MKRKLSLLILPLAITAHGQPSSCSSDGVAQPTALLERFISADCDTCWASPQAPEPAAGALAIDWVVPGSRGEDAPLSAVATRDAQDRLEALRKAAPADAESHFTPRSPGNFKLRVARGLPINNYIGTAIELRPAAGGPFKAWLLLVETLPKGSEGSAVERNLVRNSYVTTSPGSYEIRSMQIPEGARPERLRVVAWLEDSRGRIRAIVQSLCPKG